MVSNYNEWELFSLAIRQRNFRAIRRMIADGYHVTTELLEALYYSGEEETLAWIYEYLLQKRSSGSNLLAKWEKYLSEEKRTAIAEKVQRQKDEQEQAAVKRFEEALASKQLSRDLLVQALNMGRTSDLWKAFDLEEAYRFACGHTQPHLIEAIFPEDFLCGKGEFTVRIRSLMARSGNWESFLALLKDTLTYPNALRILFNKQDSLIDAGLIDLGEIAGFENAGYKGLLRMQYAERMDFQRWKHYYDQPQFREDALHLLRVKHRWHGHTIAERKDAKVFEQFLLKRKHFRTWYLFRQIRRHSH